MSLEQQLLADIGNNIRVPLERALLIASGLETENQIAKYMQKLDQIQEGFEHYKERVGIKKGTHKIKVAEALNKYFWGGRLEIYDKETFCLNKIIDRQLAPINILGPIGNCLGLSALYGVIGPRVGLDFSILVSQDHVKVRLKAGKKIKDIEPTHRWHFKEEYKEGFKEYPLETLIAGIYSSNGIIKKSSGDCKGAIKEFDKAIKINPEVEIFYKNRAIAKMRLDDLKGAQKDLEIAKRKTPKDADVYYLIADCKHRLRQFKEALKYSNKSVRLDSKDKTHFFLRGLIRGSLKDYKGAVEDFEESIKLGNENCDETYINMALAKLHLGDEKGTIKDCNKAIELGFTGGYVYSILGCAERDIDPKSAREHLKKALELNPEDRISRENLEYVEKRKNQK